MTEDDYKVDSNTLTTTEGWNSQIENYKCIPYLMDAPLIIKGKRKQREWGGKEKSKDFIVLLVIMKFKHELSVEKVGIL